MTDELPPPKEVRDVLADLLGRDVTVNSDGTPPSNAVPVTAVFVKDDLSLVGVIGFQLLLAASLAAAVGLVPPGGAKACVEDGALSPMLEDNLKEICNVLTGLFNRSGGPHIRLHQVYFNAAGMPADVAAHLTAFGNRLDLDVTVAGYGTGTMSLVLAL